MRGLGGGAGPGWGRVWARWVFWKGPFSGEVLKERGLARGCGGRGKALLGEGALTIASTPESSFVF